MAFGEGDRMLARAMSAAKREGRHEVTGTKCVGNCLDLERVAGFNGLNDSLRDDNEKTLRTTQDLARDGGGWVHRI